MASITQIRVKGRLVGLVGLKEAIEELPGLGLTQEEIPDYLLERARKKNYIPPAVLEDYREAIHRFYRRHTGLPAEGEDREEGISIRILGQGCANCDRLEQEVLAVCSELGTAADVQHVRDVREIAGYGVTGVPALVINGRVRSMGRLPSRAQIRQWIQSPRPDGA